MPSGSREYPSIKDVLARLKFEGQPVSLDDLVGKDVLFMAFEEAQGNHGPYLIIQGEVEGRLVTFTTGSIAICDKLRRAKGALPAWAKIIYTGKYYTLE
jgi:hypothetical protein